MPVRVQLGGMAEPLLAELSNASASGCFLRSPEASFLTSAGERLAFGFVTASREVGLVSGRVVRRIPGEGLAMTIEQANGAFDELLGAFAHNAKPSY